MSNLIKLPLMVLLLVMLMLLQPFTALQNFLFNLADKLHDS